MTELWHPLSHPIEAVSRIFLELSNRCNLADIHVRCPLHIEQEPAFLSAKIIKSVMDYLGQLGWKGYLSFNTYNEPTIDPRLFSLIEYARRVCPTVKLYFLTNGEWIDQILVDELKAAGVHYIQATVYTKKDKIRLEKIRGISLKDSEGPYFGLDNRIEMYDNFVQLGSKRKCYAPISEINISHKGNVRLCCYDWKEEHTFGNLNVQSLDDILRDHRLWGTYTELLKGNRSLQLCKGCLTSRGGPPVPRNRLSEIVII